jgi:hypothetical protein
MVWLSIADAWNLVGFATGVVMGYATIQGWRSGMFL